MSETLIINEIYRSLQGESTRAGLPCVLVRLTGCNLRCDWCDTQHAWNGGTEMSLDEICQHVAELDCRRVLLTGGEPLTQPASLALLTRLCDEGYETSLETNGTLDLDAVDGRVHRVVDIKCPTSGAAEENCWTNVEHLRPHDEVKFVIADRGDYEYAHRAVAEHHLVGRCEVIFSPVLDHLGASELAEWILADRLDVRLGLQLHRIIWPDRPRGV
jgi:7-carboxy-7-deazaguanine synthase